MVSRTSHLVWFAVFVLIVLAVLFFVWGRRGQERNAKQAGAESGASARQATLSADAYHARVRTILAEQGFLHVEKNLDRDVVHRQAEDARAALLSLVIPTEEREAHLALTLALGQIADGAKQQDGALLAKGTAALDLFLQTYLWARVEAPI